MELELSEAIDELSNVEELDQPQYLTVCVRDEMALEVANTDVIYEVGTSFSEMGLDQEIIKGLRDVGIHTPSMIQSNIFPYIFSDNPRNIIAQSQSGTGKTVSYILVALQVIDFSIPATQVKNNIIIRTSYQVHEKLLVIGKHLKNLRVDLAVKQSESKYRGKSQIIVGCIGTVLRWIQNIRSIHFDAIIGNPCLHLFCSATFEDKAFNIAKRMMYDPMCIRLRADQLSLDNIHQYYSKSSSDQEKIKMVCKIIKIPGVVKTIIFCNKRDDSMKICKSLQAYGVYSLTLTGKMSPKDRTNSFDRFRTGLDYSVLICTDVCSRGIDISTINAVINFHIPRGRNYEPDYSSYYHRIGRGGRFGKKSISFTLISNEEDFKFICSAEKHFKILIPETKILDNNFETDMDSLTETTNRLFLSNS
ncbi:hypothetical protein HZS_2963 [Henneguya salminicola]|nr:hypothetical protein HZS_2963 [Henneguya salminicola]